LSKQKPNSIIISAKVSPEKDWDTNASSRDQNDSSYDAATNAAVVHESDNMLDEINGTYSNLDGKGSNGVPVLIKAGVWDGKSVMYLRRKDKTSSGIMRWCQHIETKRRLFGRMTELSFIGRRRVKLYGTCKRPPINGWTVTRGKHGYNSKECCHLPF
jgi:hypothetical protein